MGRISKGLLPIIHQMKYADQVLESRDSLDTFKNGPGNTMIEVSIAGWVQKNLMKLYIDSCIELSETPNIKLFQRLYISEFYKTESEWIEFEQAKNECLQELHLADNAVLKEKHILEYAQAAKERVKASSHQRNVVVNAVSLKLADSEDGPINMGTMPSELDDSCTSSRLKNSSIEGQFIQNLSTAISMAKKLQLLDLSNIGFSSQVVESFYASWSSRLGAGLAWKHLKDEIVHFFEETSVVG
ncbi:hypothetical protein K2173_000973 [Erythroxylum novogranatense]|uniref:Uncharacterized protein n=1 Tax=Erythroxylum novogranatense TaxID=1862640 RepID=A0AAV8TR65_9ROSI|nr:hypothetical protein K2173_000973 [Erythroxylum novogranatense]